MGEVKQESERRIKKNEYVKHIIYKAINKIADGYGVELFRRGR